MVKGWGKSSPPFSQDTFAKYSPILMVAINVPDHSVENKIFSQPPPVLGGDGIGFKNSHASEIRWTVWILCLNFCSDV